MCQHLNRVALFYAGSGQGRRVGVAPPPSGRVGVGSGSGQLARAAPPPPWGEDGIAYYQAARRQVAGARCRRELVDRLRSRSIFPEINFANHAFNCRQPMIFHGRTVLFYRETVAIRK